MIKKSVQSSKHSEEFTLIFFNQLISWKWIRIPWSAILRKGVVAFSIGLMAAAYTLYPNLLDLDKGLHQLGVGVLMLGILMMLFNQKERLAAAFIAFGGLILTVSMPGLWFLPFLGVSIVFSGVLATALSLSLLGGLWFFSPLDPIEQISLFFPMFGWAGLLILLFAWVRHQSEKEHSLRKKYDSLIQNNQMGIWEYLPLEKRMIWGKNEFIVSDLEQLSEWNFFLVEESAFLLTQIFSEPKLQDKGLDLMVQESQMVGGRWLHLWGAKIPPAEGLGFRGHFVDISEIQESQQSVLERDRQLEMAMDHAEMVVFEYQIDADRLWVHPNLWKVLHLRQGEPFTAEEAIQNLKAHERRKLKRLLGMAKLKGKANQTEQVELRFRNRKNWLQLSAKVDRWGLDGKPTRIGGMVRNVTAIVQKNNSLMEMARSYQNLFDSSILGIIIHRKGVIVDVNATFASMLLFEKVDIVGKKITEFVLETEVDEFNGFINVHRDFFLTKIKNYRNLPIPVECYSKDVEIDGRIHQLLTFQDISKRVRMQEALRESQAEIKGIFEGIEDLILMLDSFGHVIDIAPTKGQAIYEGAFEWVGKPIVEISSEGLSGVEPEFFEEICSNGIVKSLEFKASIRGKEYWFSGQMSRLNEEVIVLVLQDRTAIKNAMVQIQESEERYRLLSELGEEVVIFHHNWEILDANTATEKLFGYENSEIIGLNIEKLLASRSWKNLQINSSIQQPDPFELVGLNKAGQEIPLQVMTKHFKDSDEKGVVIMNDISSRKKIEERLKHMATYDSLTDLPNRVLFNDRLQRALLQADRSFHKVCVVVIDLDGFKEVNDTMGHQAGDLVLKAMGERLPKQIRANDTLARMGGDEFAIVLPGMMDKIVTRRLIEKVIEQVAIPVQTQNGLAKVTASVGVAFYPEDGDTADSIYKSADKAMYVAKNAGKNQMSFFDEVEANSV